MRLSVLGAGAWGTAIAVLAAASERGHEVVLWARDLAQADALTHSRRNERYLSQIALPASLVVTSDFAAAMDGADLILIATPTAALRPTLRALAPSAAPVVWLCKGLEQASGKLAHEIASEEIGERASGPMSGPSFAEEAVRGMPTALTAAGPTVFCETVTRALHGGALRVYSTDDVTGVEIGGAVKNVLAIATGIADALGLGLNARAALITRGLAETTRLGVALGARTETFMGLTGVGDLILTCTGDLSRNRKVGLLLGRGVPLADALAQLGHVAEGVWSASAILARARRAGTEMPIAEHVAAVLAGELTPRAALQALLARDPRREDA